MKWTCTPPGRGRRYGVLLLACVAHWAAAGEIHGLKGQYYLGCDLETLKLERTDAQLDFNWSREVPAKDVPREFISVRWTGAVEPQFSELYTFHTLSDDGVRLWVNDRLLIDNWTDHGATEDTGSIQLEAGKRYNIRLEYYQGNGESVLKLLWSSPRQKKQVIPHAYLLVDQVPRPELPPLRVPALEVPAGLAELPRGADWEASKSAFDALGVPRSWLILTPQPDRQFRLFQRKKPLEPEETDDWRNLIQNPAFQPTLWTRPEGEEAGDAYVDVGRILGWDTPAVTFARTEVVWPVEGLARIWFSSRERGELFLDNVKLLVLEEAPRTPRCVNVKLKRGTNVFKIKLGGTGGPWGFSFRVERDDPEYRIALLKKLMVWHPGRMVGGRGTEARLLIARALEEAGRPEESLKAFRDARVRSPRDEEARVEVEEAERRLQGQADQSSSVKQEWPRVVQRVDQLVGRGEAAGADAELSLLVARFPRSEESIEALVRRGRLRQAWGLDDACRAFYQRAMDESPRHPEVVRYALPVLDVAMRQYPAVYAAETVPELSPLLEAARRQFHSGTTGDLSRAVRNLDEAWRMGSDLFVAGPARGAPRRDIGIPLALRQLVEPLDAASLTAYGREVEAGARAETDPAGAAPDVTALVRRAARFPLTSLAVGSLNRAANRLMDVGRWEDAAALFGRMAQEAERLQLQDAWVEAEAKHVRALIGAGEGSSAEAVMRSLEKRMQKQELMLRGQGVNGAEFAQQQSVWLQQAVRVHASRPALATLNGHASRVSDPVPALPDALRVAWRAVQPRSPAHLRACERTGVQAPLISCPVVAGNRVFVAHPESLAAFDLETGRLIWQVRHSPETMEWPAAFWGYPVSSPSYADGLVFLRVPDREGTDLCAFSAGDGALRWRYGGRSDGPALVWLGDPAVACGSVYGVFMEQVANGPARHGVVCLDASAGELKWKRYILSGTAGWRLGGTPWAPSLHQGPPAVADGVLYVSTGLNSLAALDAFTGQPLWLTAYPAPETGEVEHDGWFRPCLTRLLRRGPASLLVMDGRVFLAPRDAPGLFAFNASTGELLWSRDLSDALQLVADPVLGLCAAGERWELIDPASGRERERKEIPGARLGCPAIAGSKLYAATTDGLAILDGGGKEPPALMKWKDLGLSPAHSCFVAGSRLLLMGDGEMAALTVKGLRDVSLPLDQARAQAEQGNWAEAGRRYAVAMRRQRECFLEAICGWATAHLRMGFERRAQAELDYWLSGQPDRLVSADGLWEVDREALREGLRFHLGQVAPAALRTLPRGLSGVLAFAGHIPMKEPHLVLPPEGLGAIFWAAEQFYVSGLQLGTQPKVLWRSYHGLADPRFEVGPTALAVWDAQKLIVFDRMTGQQLWSVALEGLREQAPAQTRLERYASVALDREVVVAATRDVLLAFDAGSGRQRWAQVDKDRHTRHLGLLGGRVVEVGGEKQRYYRGIDVETGKESVRRDLGPGVHMSRVEPSPDGRWLAVRMDDEHVACLDLASGAWAWNSRVRKLKRETCRLTWRESVLCYEGEAEEAKAGRRTIELRAQDGELLRDRPAGLWPVARDYLRCAEREAEEQDMERLQWAAGRPEAEPRTVWQYGLSRDVSRGGLLRGAFLSEKEERVQLLFTRNPRQPHFVLRSFDWSRGQFVHEEILPGVPFLDEGGRRYDGQAEVFEDQLLYTGVDGLYVFRGAGQTRREAAGALDLLLASSPGAQTVRNLRRARAGVEPPRLHVLRAPEGFRLWSDPALWEQADALTLDAQASFVPLTQGAEWRGPADLSATLRVLWSPEGLFVSVVVTDDRHVPALVSAPLESGDSLRLVIDATPDLTNGFDPGARWSGTLAWAEGRTSFKSDRAIPSGPGYVLEGGAIPLPDGNGVRYEVRVPWALLGRAPTQRPGPARQVRFGLAVYDDDGTGVRGAVEWGAGATVRPPCSPWLGELFLLDASREWMARYRAVIAKIPDAPEALDFLRRLVLSHRGPMAAATRVAELEAFVKAHPNSPNLVPVLRMLYRACKEQESASPRARLLALTNEAKCPAEIVRQLELWPRPADPGQGLEGEYFDNQDFTGLAVVRIDPVIDFAWGASGPVPSMAPTSFSVRWTGQLIPKHTESYTFYALSDDGVRVWVDDRLLIDNWTDHPTSEDEGRIFLNAGTPYDVKLEYFQGFGGAGLRLCWSSLSQPKAPVPTECLYPSGLPFLQAPAVAPEPAKMRDAYREAALLLPDDPEGAVLFERLLEAWPPDAWKERIQECEAYLKARPGTQHAATILMKLREWYPKVGLDPVEACKVLMRTYRVQEEVQRAFFSQHVPAWSSWQVIGPFPTVGLEVGMDEVWPPERGVDLAWKATPADGFPLAWKQTDVRKNDASGRVDLQKWFSDKLPRGKARDVENSPRFVYAYRSIRANQQRRAMIFFGADEVISIWLNGKPVVNRARPGGQKDAQALDITLKEGENEILLKVGAAEGRMGFFFRIADPNGCPLPDLPAQ